MSTMDAPAREITDQQFRAATRGMDPFERSMWLYYDAGYRRYEITDKAVLVESPSGRIHTVSRQGWSCDCPAGENGARCWAVYTAQRAIYPGTADRHERSTGQDWVEMPA